MKEINIHKILSFIFLAATLIVNYLSNALPINGKTAGELSDAIDSYFVPAGFVFSIWGVIYTALIAFVIYQATIDKKVFSKIKEIYPWFYVSSIANISWLFAWHYQLIGLSLVIIFILLIALVMIYKSLLRVKIYNALKNRIFIYFPFSIYLAWICVAVLANFSGFIATNNLYLFNISPQFFSLFLISITTFLGIFIINVKINILFLMVLISAMFGIAIKFQNEELIIGGIIISIASILISSCIKLSFKILNKCKIS